MNAGLFISTTGRGIARAERDADDGWTVTTALEDQDVRCLAADPLDPNRVYAGTQGAGILRSDDRGRSWRPVGMAGQVVKSIGQMRDLGLIIEQAICVIDRQEGGAENLAAIGVQLSSVFTLAELPVPPQP